MYISMRGTGVGFSVESQNIQALPQIKNQSGEEVPTHVVADSAEGWCDALTLGLKTWYDGKDIEFDFSAAASGGSAPEDDGRQGLGPGATSQVYSPSPAQNILARQGRRLRNIDAHDVICTIGACVVAGGVRRSAMISLSDLDDTDLRDAKKGQFFMSDPQRSIANNSAVYSSRPEQRGIHGRMDRAHEEPGRRARHLQSRRPPSRSCPKRRTAQWEKTGYIAAGPLHRPAGNEPVRRNYPQVEAVLQSYRGHRARRMRGKPHAQGPAGDHPRHLPVDAHQPAVPLPGVEGELRERSACSASLSRGSGTLRRRATPRRSRAMRAETIAVNKKYAKRFGVDEFDVHHLREALGNRFQTFDVAAACTRAIRRTTSAASASAPPTRSSR